MRLEDDLAWVVPWPIVLAQIVLIKLIVLLSLSSILLLLFLSLVPIETGSLDRVMHILVLKLSASPIGLNRLLPILLSFAIQTALITPTILPIHINQATVFFFTADVDEFGGGWLRFVIARAEVELAGYATQAVFALTLLINKQLIFALKVLVHHDLLLRTWVNSVISGSLAERLQIYLFDAVIIVIVGLVFEIHSMLVNTLRAVSAETVPVVGFLALEGAGEPGHRAEFLGWHICRSPLLIDAICTVLILLTA